MIEGLSAVVAAFRCPLEGGEGSRFGVVFDRPRSLGVIVTGLAAARYRLPPSLRVACTSQCERVVLRSCEVENLRG